MHWVIFSSRYYVVVVRETRGRCGRCVCRRVKLLWYSISSCQGKNCRQGKARKTRFVIPQMIESPRMQQLDNFDGSNLGVLAPGTRTYLLYIMLEALWQWCGVAKKTEAVTRCKTSWYYYGEWCHPPVRNSVLRPVLVWSWSVYVWMSMGRKTIWTHILVGSRF